MNMNALIRYLLPGWLLWTFLPAFAAERPNIVWILSEDSSKHYLELFDPGGAPTPNLEKLAREGVIFERAFSNAPVCSVARTTLLTSCLAPRIGTHHHRKLKTVPMPPGVEMFPVYLRRAGYHTTNNSKKDYNARESREVWDASSKRASWRDRPDAKTPFFHMRTFTQSHESSLHFQKIEERWKTGKEVQVADYHPDTPTFRATYRAYHERIGTIDQKVGQLVEELERDGLLENTIIFYFGDHGGVLPGSKGYLREGGLHVPLIVRIPEKFRDRSPLPRGSRSQAFVSFIDFGPTVLRLAGVEAPSGIDGKAFLGSGVSREDLQSRDWTFGHADRFDEKYDLSRSIRVGDFKYVRNFEPHLPHGLQNNYRYRMLAYREWRQLFREGKLDRARSSFFRSKPAESLHDLSRDPHEVNNLAGAPEHQERLVQLRQRLHAKMAEISDLGVYPESYLVDEVLDDPTGFGQRKSGDIARILRVSRLALEPVEKALEPLRRAASHEDPWTRHRALIVATGFGKKASSLVPVGKKLLEDPELLVRLRACEFLGVVGELDPLPFLTGLLNSTESPVEALIILNTVVFFVDHGPEPRPFDVSKIRFRFGSDALVDRRLEYLRSR